MQSMPPVSEIPAMPLQTPPGVTTTELLQAQWEGTAASSAVTPSGVGMQAAQTHIRGIWYHSGRHSGQLQQRFTAGGGGSSGQTTAFRAGAPQSVGGQVGGPGTGGQIQRVGVTAGDTGLTLAEQTGHIGGGQAAGAVRLPPLEGNWFEGPLITGDTTAGPVGLPRNPFALSGDLSSPTKAPVFGPRGARTGEPGGRPRTGTSGDQLELEFNKGGFVPGYQYGGEVDTIPAYLSAGEFVMQKDSVKNYGKKFMNDVNLQRLQHGGSVGGAGSGGSSTGGTKVSQSKDLERGAKMAGDSILKAFTEGATKAANAIKEALSPENLAAQIGDVVGQKMKESIAATEIKMTTTSQVNLTGDGATGDVARKLEGTITDAIAGAFNNRTNVDGSAKDPSLHRDSLA